MNDTRMKWFRVLARKTKECVVLVEAHNTTEAEDIVYGLLDGGGIKFSGSYNCDFDGVVLSEADSWDMNNNQYEKFEYNMEE